MVSVSLSAFVLLYSNFQVQRLAWNLWIRINLLIRHILMIRHECCPPLFFLALERNEMNIVNTGANVTESGFLPNVETKQN
ncbi:hypothetical protein EMCRGX_G006097 [Ephydatia muelleri]